MRRRCHLRTFLLISALELVGPGCRDEEAAVNGSVSASSSASLTLPVASITAATSSPPASASATASSSVPRAGEGPIAKLLADALLNPKPYNGQPVKVRGVYVGTKSRNIGALMGDSYQPHMVVDVLIADSKDDVEHAIWCEMNKWVPPPGLEKLGAVTAEGRGYMDLPAAGVKLVIGNCTLTAQ